MSPEEAQEMIRGLRVEAEWVDTDRVNVASSPDPDDNFILAIGIARQSDDVISRDRADMLSLGVVEDIPIITTRQAIDMLQR